ncbi:mitochondrial chaperone BCS1 [Cavenderia fasciculata]|uniref:Mitochondrial chaperone BCS1 n=1 Tax=Cavenderia fasciculata TaxID=261658 RepID=F4PGZ5_CACFS|nr:mitochondrial chaperone BCS1 [Cavenderia fasciculata]EGG24979.1 mitochondrial chaperone BCS1 [Cavenderia fasciculata]|eukprot:XP_004362830.1 mitochondrial chaperone BCS1 [Cavenderia fasciculata]
MASGAPFESIVLTVFGNDGNVIQQLVTDAMELSLRRDEGKTVIYISSGGSWERFGTPRTARSLDSVILPQQGKDGLVSDIRDFLSSEEWFRNRGIPYRRGYLLHGPPGNGKSSLVNAIAGELKLDICIVSLSNSEMDDHQFNSLLNNAPPKSILLIEDVDAAFSRRSASSEVSSKLSFSGILNALDGVASQEGRILFMTTNHLEVLDSALIREGRVDLKIQISNATKQQAQQLFTYFYSLDNQNPSNLEMATQFASKITDYSLSMSQIQGFLLQYKSSPQKALKHINKLIPVSLV